MGTSETERRKAAYAELDRHQGVFDTATIAAYADHTSADLRDEFLDRVVINGTVKEVRLVARALAQDPNWIVRMDAVEALGECGNQKDVRRLIAAVQDEHWGVRAAAASSLSAFHRAKSFRAIVDALADKNPHVRRYAAVALVEQGFQEALPPLRLAATKEKSNLAKPGLFEALYRFGEPDTLEPRLVLLEDPDHLVRYLALNGLEDFVRPEDRQKVVIQLRKLIEAEPESYVRERAIVVLNAFTTAAAGEQNST